MSRFIGNVSAYAYAVSKGYTGTEEEFAELMASYATVGQTAVEAAETATTKASEAATSATTATNKASEATTAATTATTKAGEASTSASTATSAKDTAVSASQTATTKATEATTAAATATSAKTDAVAANTAAQSAKTAAQTAQTGAETAAASVQSSAAQITTNTEDIAQLKEDLNRYGATNIMPINNGTFYPGSLTIVRNGNTAAISGTTTGIGYTHLDFFNSSNSFPTGIQAGTKLQVSQNCSDSNVRFRVYQKVGDTSTILCDIAGTGTALITMGADATGCIIRLSCANGNTYSSAVTAMYVFGTLTKQQTQGQIDALSSGLDNTNTQVNGFKSYLPTAGDKQIVNANDVSVIHARVKSSDSTLIEDANYDAIIVPASIVSGDTYFAKIFSQTLSVSEIKLYTFNSVSIGSVAVDSSDSYSAGQMRSRLPSTASASYFILVLQITSGNIADAISGLVIAKTTTVPTEYQPYYITVDEAIDNAMGKVTSPDCVEVGTSSDDYAYTSIESAVQANPNSIIKVNYGTYETEVTDLSTDKILVGLDKDLCILTGTDKDYDTPPIEIAGGMVKHFTVSMANDDEAEHKGYCIHSDNAACANNTLIVEDCKFDCIGQHTIGMGIYPGETVIYNSCEFVFKDEEATPAHAPFFAHNSGASDGVAKVIFHDCIFRGSGYALKLSAYSSNCSIKFEFIDCTCESDTLTGDNMVWTDYVTGDTHDTSKMHEFSGKFTLLPTSHGNNVDVLNYSA